MKKYIKQNNIIKGDIVDNNNKQLFTRFYGVAIALILGVLSLSVQAQYPDEPTDFDRLLSGEFNAVAPPTVANADCDAGGDTNSFDCSGVLYLRLSPTLNIGDSTAVGGNQLVVRMEARAGQEAVGTPFAPASCINPNTNEELVLLSFGSPVPITNALQCEGAGQQAGLASGVAEFTSAEAGTIDADNSANLMHHIEARFTYSKEIFPGNPDNFTTVCAGVTEYTSAQVGPIPPRNNPSSADNGVITYSYESAILSSVDPGTVGPDGRVQYPADDYAEIMTLTCNLPASASAQLWGMSYHLSAYGNSAFAHHTGIGDVDVQGDEADSYVTSPENSLEFFPLDGSNYIEHAEITEGGDGVLIEYAQAVTDNTDQAYTITAADGSDIAPTISEIIWLNNQTVWLALASDIYTGVNNGSNVALDADRHVLVASAFPSDTSFGTNFAQASTYRVVLTRHMSQVDLAQTAPRITGIEVADGTESIALTFSEAVCGGTEAGCVALTADHFEVMYYGETETRELTVTVDVTGTVATLTLLPEDIGGYWWQRLPDCPYGEKFKIFRWIYYRPDYF